jgi:hypothetical protein
VAGGATFSSRLGGLKLIPIIWCCLVPSTSPLQGVSATGNVSREFALYRQRYMKESISYLNRLQPILRDGIRIGAIYGFSASLLYNAVVLLYLLISSLVQPASLDQDSTLRVAFVVGAWSCMLNLIPSVLLGGAGGALIAALLSIPARRVTNQWASLIGLTVGTVVVLVADYLLWLRLGKSLPFWTFMFPRDLNIAFIYFRSPFLLPSLIPIILSAICARQINKQEPMEKNAG